MFKHSLPAAALCAALLSTPAYADDYSINPGIGTNGLGVYGTIPVTHNWNARLGVNYMTLSTIMRDPDGDTQVNITLNTFDVLLDWYPYPSTFHLTGGLAYNNNRINTLTKLNGVTYQGTTYTLPFGSSLGQVDGTINVGNILSPYLGIGWGNAFKQDAGWSFTADFGLLFHGKPVIDLQSNNCTAGPACAALAVQVANEETRLNEEYASKIVYPIARIGGTYWF